MEQQKMYLDETYVLMTNRKFKTIKYRNGQKEMFELEPGVKVKIDALNFFRVIEFFNKIDQEGIIFNTEDNRFFQLSDKTDWIKIKIPVCYPLEENEICRYSVEYLKSILKEYSVKELKDEFIELEFKTDYPLTFKFKEDFGVLAPKVESE